MGLLSGHEVSPPGFTLADFNLFRLRYVGIFVVALARGAHDSLSFARHTQPVCCRQFGNNQLLPATFFQAFKDARYPGNGEQAVPTFIRPLAGSGPTFPASAIPAPTIRCYSMLPVQAGRAQHAFVVEDWFAGFAAS